MSLLLTSDIDNWFPDAALAESMDATRQLEQGKVLYFPEINPLLDKSAILDKIWHVDYLKKGAKNISYNPNTGVLKGIKVESKSVQDWMGNYLSQFAKQSCQLISQLCPHYAPYLQMGRTSFRPVEVKGRESSFRKDDSLLHVDAFPSLPMHGNRILRLFYNINPDQQPRRWQLGELFNQVFNRFWPKLSKPFPLSDVFLYYFKMTKSKRSLYDHYMLSLHNAMKADSAYQNEVVKETVDFPANSVWCAYTDMVSHAALTGQYLLEQTFVVPLTALLDNELSPAAQIAKATPLTLG